ncbi:MAG TPA: outer membrane beta-barrel protein [Gemmatimonadales bacterium]|nr:outer membrane beta-barrel protein [Gemmatimonadales bacterium]
MRMLRLLVVMTALGVATTLPGGELLAQIGGRVSGGLEFPLGTTNDAFNLGWNARAGVLFSIPRFPSIVFDANGAYTRLGATTPVGGTKGPGLRILDAQLNASYRVLTGVTGQARPYITAGLGFFNSKAVGDVVPAGAGSNTDLGFNVGAGFEFRLERLAMFAEGRFTDIMASGPNIKYIPINVGLVLGGR